MKRGRKPGNSGKNRLLFCAALLAALVVAFLPLPESMAGSGAGTLTDQGQRALGVLAFALILWVTEALPFHITGLFGMILLQLFGVGEFKTIIKEGFGSDTAVFFIGVLVMSAFITQSGLGKRISLKVLTLTGNRTAFILLGIMAVGMLLSMWVTAMAGAAIVMPMALGILEGEGVTPQKSNFGRGLLIGCAWGSTLGGIATPAGASANPVSISLLRDMAGVELTFFDWMVYGLPAALLLILPGWLLLLAVFPPEIRQLSRSREELQADYRALPPITAEEGHTLAIFCLTVFLWLSTPLWETLLHVEIPIALPAILAACLFFLPGVSRIKWDVIEKHIGWGSILLVVSGLSLGAMLYQSGAAQWLSRSLLGGIGGLHPLLQVFVVVMMMALLKVFFSSNAVTATVLIPVVISLAQHIGVPPLALAMPAALTASFCFLLVTSSPTNMIPYTAGYFSIKDFARAGIPMTLVSGVIVTLTVYGVGLWTGLY